MKLPKHSYAFIDGSFNPDDKICGYGGFLISQFGKRYNLSGKTRKPDWVKMRNVAGEILGAKAAIKLAISLGMDTLTIFYDCQGVEKWATGEWKCKKKETKKYSEFVQKVMASGFKLYFEHVRGHSGNAHNEEADYLAKKAAGLR